MKLRMPSLSFLKKRKFWIYAGLAAIIGVIVAAGARRLLNPPEAETQVAGTRGPDEIQDLARPGNALGSRLIRTCGAGGV